MNIFSSAGDLGDLIYQLPTIQSLGGGSLNLHTQNQFYIRQPWTQKSVSCVTSFLLSQPYISDVKFSNKPEGIVIDDWRLNINNNMSLADNVAVHFNVTPHPLELPWAEVEPNRISKYVLHRSGRYHYRRFPWKEIVKKIGREAVMVGSREEHINFCDEFGDVEYYFTKTILDLAGVIAGSEMFVGNQSAPRAIAESLKVSVWQETGNPPNCYFERNNAFYFPNDWPI